MASSRWLATGNFFTTYKEEQRIFLTHLDRLALILLVAALYVWPIFFELGPREMLVADNILIAMVAVMGLNLVTGYAGLISIGHAAFLGVGAYTTALMAAHLGHEHIIMVQGWPLVIIISGLVGAAFGAFVGLPALRLKHLYLAIATLSFQMIFEWTVGFMKFFNQGQTMSVERVALGSFEVTRSNHYTFWYFTGLTIVVLSGFMVRNIMRTKYGRCLVAVRDNDRAADAMGMHPGFTKVYAFALAGFFAGVAGSMHAFLFRGAGIESFTLAQSISFLAMAIVGGLGTLPGSFLGPTAIKILDIKVEGLAETIPNYIPAASNLSTGLRPLSFGLVIVLFLMFEPRGIANWWRITRNYFKLWPFRY